MSGKKTRRADLLREMLVMVVAGLFVMAFASSGMAATPFSYTGKIVAIDNAAKILTVEAGPSDQLIFSMNEYAAVTKCDKIESWNNLKIGDEVTVSYFQESGGSFVADNVSLLPMMGERC